MTVKIKDGIRIQRSRNGLYFQLVRVYYTPDNVKVKIYFSIPYKLLYNYVNHKSGSFYVIAKRMCSKDSLEYKKYLKDKRVYDNNLKLKSLNINVQNTLNSQKNNLITTKK
jgi:hypothetical protein